MQNQSAVAEITRPPMWYGSQMPPVPGTVNGYGVLSKVYNLLGLNTVYTEYRGNFSRVLEVAENEYA
jgi:hypothetical protein